MVSYLDYSSALTMEATCLSETSVEFQQKSWRYIAEERTLQDFWVTKPLLRPQCKSRDILQHSTGLQFCSNSDHKVPKKMFHVLTFITAGHVEVLQDCMYMSVTFLFRVISYRNNHTTNENNVIMLYFTCWQHRRNMYCEKSTTASVQQN
jgi:hypothetical protein